MGLANLVPGISGGTMLLAAGVYPQCIDAVARAATFRPDRKGLALLLTVAASSGVVILLLAGPVRDLVVSHRWVMYSIFLGSTIGGVPPLWRLIGRPNSRSWIGASLGLAAMVATTFFPADSTAAGPGQSLTLFLTGLGAFAAMILPGLSGGYILVLSGQYVPILGAVDGFKAAVLGSSGDRLDALSDACLVLVPFALGGVLALAGVSSLVRLLLRKQRSLMLGLLLGLLAGALFGLWPFGTTDSQPALPGLSQLLAALALVLVGFLVTYAVARIGDTDPDARQVDYDDS